MPSVKNGPQAKVSKPSTACKPELTLQKGYSINTYIYMYVYLCVYSCMSIIINLFYCEDHITRKLQTDRGADKLDWCCVPALHG